MVGDVEQQAGVDAVTTGEEPWIVGSVLETLEEEGWQRPKKMTHEMAKFLQQCGGPVKISTGCVEECCVKESRRPLHRTLDAWLPRRSGVSVKNKFRELQVGAVDENEEEDTAAVNDEANGWFMRVTVDSVWPRRKKGSAEEEVR